jgi:hypothetical protein
MSRLAALLRGIAALFLLVALLVGVPIALWRFVGWPLPHTIPTWSQLRAGLTAHGIPDDILLKTLACICWVAWLGLLTSVLAETGAMIRGRAARRLPLLGLVQPLAAQLVTAIVLAVTATSASPQRTAAAPLQAALTIHRPFVVATGQASSDGNGDRRTGVELVNRSSRKEYVVIRHDTLWGIAQRELGDPFRWREIYRLNEGHPQPDGRVLSDPNLIYPGWVFRLPGSIDTHAGSKTGPAPDHRPATPKRPKPEPTPSTRRHASPSPNFEPSSPAPASTSSPPASIDLPSGAYLAGSFAAGVLAALVAGRLRRRRLYRPAAPEPGRVASPTPLAPALQQLLNAMRSEDDADHAPDAASSTQEGESVSRLARPLEVGRLDPEVVDAGVRVRGQVIMSEDGRRNVSDHPRVSDTQPTSPPSLSIRSFRR